MSVLNDHIYRTKVFHFVVLLFLSLILNSAKDAAGAEAIDELAKEAALTRAEFMRESFALRMRYEYYGGFANDGDKAELYAIAKNSSGSLEKIAAKQKILKQQIEDYEGDDWEVKYGSSGLWRRLCGQLYVTELSKCEVEFYRGLAAGEAYGDEILRGVLTEMDSFESVRLGSASELLKVKIFAFLSQRQPGYKVLAKNGFDQLSGRSDMSGFTAFKISIEEMKFSGQLRRDGLEEIAEALGQRSYPNDIELVLALGFLRRGYDSNAFRKMVVLRPKTKDFLGSLVLTDLSGRFGTGALGGEDLKRMSVFDVELAALAAWKDWGYKELLEYFISKKNFRTALTLYVTAAGVAEDEPAKAIELLIEASVLQSSIKNDNLEIEADGIAKQAVRLAYNLFVESKENCQLAVRAFDNYSEIAGREIDEELEYLYSGALRDCGDISRSNRLLEKIASKSGDKWRNKARLSLIGQAIERDEHRDIEWLGKLVGQLAGLITDPNLRGQSDPRLPTIAMELLEEFVERIDEKQMLLTDFGAIIFDCGRIARFCYDFPDYPQRYQAGLFLAELSVFAAKKEQKQLLLIDKLIQDLAKTGGEERDVDLLRCRAMLWAAEGKFEQAAGVWAKVCRIRKSELPKADRRSWEWWRAKFNELSCWSKYSGVQTKEILHTIEVLENTFRDIPPFWVRQLRTLKKI